MGSETPRHHLRHLGIWTPLLDRFATPIFGTRPTLAVNSHDEQCFATGIHALWGPLRFVSRRGFQMHTKVHSDGLGDWYPGYTCLASFVTGALRL